MSAEKLIDRLDKVREIPGKHPRNWQACCPAHDDKTPSLSVAETDNGNVLIHCWAGCPGADVVAAVGLEWAELMPEHLRQRPERKPRPKPSRIDETIEEVLGYVEGIGHEQLVLDIARLMRREGVALSDEDLARERLAFDRIRRSAAA